MKVEINLNNDITSTQDKKGVSTPDEMDLFTIIVNNDQAENKNIVEVEPEEVSSTTEEFEIEINEDKQQKPTKNILNNNFFASEGTSEDEAVEIKVKTGKTKAKKETTKQPEKAPAKRGRPKKSALNDL